MEEKISIIKKGFRLAGLALFGIIAAGFFAMVFAIIVKELWNWLMPGLFGLPVITFLQAFGIILLSRLLVGGWHRGGHDRRNHSDGHDHFHRFFDSGPCAIPEDISRDRKSFVRFWEEQGRSSYEEYRKTREETL